MKFRTDPLSCLFLGIIAIFGVLCFLALLPFLLIFLLYAVLTGNPLTGHFQKIRHFGRTTQSRSSDAQTNDDVVDADFRVVGVQELPSGKDDPE